MKKYTIKNYKGNLVESLKRFSEKYKGMRIVEAVEDGKMLKIKADTLTEGKHWPEDYLKVEKNKLKKAFDFLSDKEIDADLQTILDAFEPLSHKSSNLKYFGKIIDELISHCNNPKYLGNASIKDKYINFIENDVEMFVNSYKKSLGESSYDSAGVTAWCSIVMDNVDEDDVVDILTDAELKYNVKIVRKYNWEMGVDGNKGFVDDVIEVHAPDMETFRKFVSEWIFAGQAQQDEIDDYIKDSLSKDTASSNNSQNIDLQSYDL